MNFPNADQLALIASAEAAVKAHDDFLFQTSFDLSPAEREARFQKLDGLGREAARLCAEAAALPCHLPTFQRAQLESAARVLGAICA